jgi:hypothetical protein
LFEDGMAHGLDDRRLMVKVRRRMCTDGTSRTRAHRLCWDSGEYRDTVSCNDVFPAFLRAVIGHKFVASKWKGAFSILI